MIKQKITYNKTNFLVKSFKEFSNDNLISHEKYNDNGKHIYKEYNDYDNLKIIVKFYYNKTNTIKCVKKYVNGVISTMEQYDDLNRVKKILYETGTTIIVKYNKIGKISLLKLIYKEDVKCVKLLYENGVNVKRVFYNGQCKNENEIVTREGIIIGEHNYDTSMLELYLANINLRNAVKDKDKNKLWDKL